ncbi:MAG: protein translocase subunit SecD, partial [Betaproteobacteria bacterium]|nr:protein translocase subunit SecD [Betaproteobacteria bacterium]
MNRYPLWKYLIVVFSVLLGILFTLPNFYGESPAVQISPLRATDKADTVLLARVEDALRKDNIPINGMFLETVGIKVRFADTDTQLKAKDVLQSVLGNGYVVALNLLSDSPQWLTDIGALPMYLGLDLRGGVHFLLQVDMKGALSKSLDRYSIDIRGNLREEKIRYKGLDREGSQIIIKFGDTESRARASDEINKSYDDLNLREQDVEDEFHLAVAIKQEALKRMQDSAVQQNIITLRNRVNELGVAEPIIQQAGADRVVVQLPGVQDTAKAKDILGRTATLELRMVDEEHDVSSALRGQGHIGSELYTERGGGPLLVKKQVMLTGERITDAQPGFDNNNQPAVHIS